ncbi:MAG TPA: hypothetical protein VLU94_03100 [Candidatus Nitrosotalea sp.]|nr:hypothetical protein [Candidatus Nitrosotalea sp.]
MTIEYAERLSKEYQRVLQEDDKRGGRRNPAQLPSTKERIITALKIELAQLFYIYGRTNEALFKPLINAAMFIDSFDELPLDASRYIESMHRRRSEMEWFLEDLLKVERPHPFYWQHIYSILGLTSETKTTSFFEGIKQKLKMRQQPSSTQKDRIPWRRPTDRFTID